MVDSQWYVYLVALLTFDNSCQKFFYKIFTMKEHIRKIHAHQPRLKILKQFLSCHTKIMPFHFYLSYTDKTVLLFSAISWKKVVRLGSHLHLPKSAAFSWFQVISSWSVDFSWATTEQQNCVSIVLNYDYSLSPSRKGES